MYWKQCYLLSEDHSILMKNYDAKQGIMKWGGIYQFFSNYLVSQMIFKYFK